MEVIITSPTYEGVVSDIKGIAEETHRFGAVLIVDEAHGAHFNFNDKFPGKCGKMRCRCSYSEYSQDTAVIYADGTSSS